MPINKVLIIADPAVDLYMNLPELQKMQIASASPESDLFAGGTGGNTAGALAKIGNAVALMGAVGADAFGKFFKNDLEKIGVDISQIVEVENSFTLLCTVAVTQSRDRYFTIYPAVGYAAGLLDGSHRKDDHLSGISWLHASGSCLSELPARLTLLESMQEASKKGIPISLDLNLRPRNDQMPEDYQKAIEDAIGYADFVLGSAEEEFHPLTGIAAPEIAARNISDGKRTVISRLGEKGSLAVAPNGEVVFAEAFSVKVFDTLGAGDVYDAGFIAACLQDKPIHEALQWGNALAALSISKKGAYRFLNRSDFLNILHT
ncbi:MAG: sugar kinase [Anaerolineaceae bacterium]|nr:sugar kinase [Anaerolineaceae bacterium]